MHLKKKQQCRIVPPNWMDKDLLEDKKEEEKRVAHFTQLPSEEFMTISKVVFGFASEEVAAIEEIKTIIKDIFDIRQAKLRGAIDAFFAGRDQLEDPTHEVSFNNLTTFEINSVKPFFPYAADFVARYGRVSQMHASSTNDTTTHNSSSYLQSSSSYQ
jgi:GINS complex subunit 2